MTLSQPKIQFHFPGNAIKTQYLYDSSNSQAIDIRTKDVVPMSHIFSTQSLLRGGGRGEIKSFFSLKSKITESAFKKPVEVFSYTFASKIMFR